MAKAVYELQELRRCSSVTTQRIHDICTDGGRKRRYYV